eukprot:3940513-Rhodomonas_salina.3
MSGTDVAYRGMRCPVLTYRIVVWSSARATRCPVLGYALPGTTIGSASRLSVLRQRMVLRIRYGMCGTELAYGATCVLCNAWYSSSVWRYERAMQCPELRQRM